MKTTVGAIGLGAMGGGTAGSLRRSGFPVQVFDLRIDVSAHQMFMQASSAGHDKEDDSVVIKILPGIELPAAKP